MCGIFGIVRFDDGIIDSNFIRSMGLITSHRGPDHTGIFEDNHIAMGNNRLAIIDISAGNQPIFNENGNLIIVFNGEIYNHLDIRKELKAKGHSFKTFSDTETVLHAFEEYGADCLIKLNGMFAFAIWNKVERRLFLARDRLGIKPLYITDMKNGLAFSSESKALLPLLKGEVRPNWNSISRFFSFGYCPTPDSPFLGIKKFPQGSYGQISDKQYKTSKFWYPRYGRKNNVSYVDACDQLEDLLHKAINAELLSDVPVGIFLSGGIDSSAVAYFAKQCSNDLTHSFSIGFEEKTHDESEDAKLVAEHLGLSHHECLLNEKMLKEAFLELTEIMDEPFGDSTVLPLLILSKYARNFVKVVLTGWGGDEVFAGYPTYQAHLISRLYRCLPNFLTNKLIPEIVNRLPVGEGYMSFDFKAKRFVKGIEVNSDLQHFEWMGYFEEQQKKSLFSKSIYEEITENALTPVRNYLPEIKEKDTISRILNLDSKFFLEGNGLFQADRITMAASLEARVPLLNIFLLDFVNDLPAKIKMRHGKLKSMLKDVMATHLPSRILSKPKKGFGPPSSAWTKGLFFEILTKQFCRDRVENIGVFNFDTIDRMLVEHKTNIADHGRNLWALLSFQLWYDRYILKQGFSYE